MTTPPRRLLDAPEGTVPSKEERLLTEYLQAVPAPTPLSDASVQRIAHRLDAPPRPWWAGPRAPLLMLGASMALAAAWSLRSERVESAVPPPALIDEAARREPEPAETHPRAVAPVPEEVAAAEIVTAPVSPRVSERRRRVRATPAAVQAEPSPPLPPVVATVESPMDPLIEESKMLRSALHELRTRRDGAAALAVVDQYQQRFPDGQLRAEMTLAQVDALLLLARSAEALGELQQLPASERARLPRARELRVLESELLAALDRCGEALARLERFSEQDPLLAERALFVRATCEAKEHRVDRARALYEELLRRHPHGAHAAQARRALGRTP